MRYGRYRLLIATISFVWAVGAHAQGLDLSSVTPNGGPAAFNTHFDWGGSETKLTANGETQTYTSNNVSADGAGITLTAQANGTSGAITSATETNGPTSYGMPAAGGFSMTYGTVNVTGTLPVGQGLWPAIWLMPIKPGVACEIDINEAPFNDPGKYQASLHDGGTGYTTSVAVPDMRQSNTYGVSMQPDYITYLLNGKPVGRTPTPPQCNTPLYLLSNIATGGWAGNTNQSTKFPATMKISSVSYDPGPVGHATGGLLGGASPSVPMATAAAIATPNPTPVDSSLQPSEASGTITPGHGSATDCHGNVWTISASGSIMEGDQYTPGGGGTSALMVNGCNVLGEDSSGKGWFDLSSDGQYWTPSSAPPPDIPITTEIANGPAVPPPTIDVPATPADQAPVVCGNAASGAFHVAGGLIIGPDGKPWIARGINVYGDSSGASQPAMITSTFTGLNFIRYVARPLNAPSSYDAFVNAMTSQGRVVEFENHPDGGGGQGTVYTGARLAAESAWYAAMAAHFKNNPYVWFGTYNEPPTQ